MVWKIIELNEEKLVAAKREKRCGRFIFGVSQEMCLKIIDDEVLKNDFTKTKERCRAVLAILKNKPVGWISPPGDYFVGQLFAWLVELQAAKDAWNQVLYRRRNPLGPPMPDNGKGCAWDDVPHVPFVRERKIPVGMSIPKIDGWTGKVIKTVPIPDEKRASMEQSASIAPPNVKNAKKSASIAVVNMDLPKGKTSLVNSGEWMLVKKGGKLEKMETSTLALPLAKEMPPVHPIIFSALPQPVFKMEGKSYAEAVKSPPKNRPLTHLVTEPIVEKKKKTHNFFFKRYWRHKRGSLGEAFKVATITPALLSKMFKAMKVKNVKKIEKEEMEAWPLLGERISPSKVQMPSLGGIVKTILNLPNKKFQLSSLPKMQTQEEGKQTPKRSTCIFCKKHKQEKPNTIPSCGCVIHQSCYSTWKKDNNDKTCPKHCPKTTASTSAQSQPAFASSNSSSRIPIKDEPSPKTSPLATLASSRLESVASNSLRGRPSKIPRKQKQTQKARDTLQTMSSPTPSQDITAESQSEMESFAEPKPPKDICDWCKNFIALQGRKKKGDGPKQCKRNHKMHAKCLLEQKKKTGSDLCLICNPLPDPEERSIANQDNSSMNEDNASAHDISSMASMDEASQESASSIDLSRAFSVASSESDSRPRYKGRFVKKATKTRRMPTRGADGRFSNEIPIAQLESIMAENTDVYYDPDGLHILRQDDDAEDPPVDKRQGTPPPPRRNPPRNRRQPDRFDPSGPPTWPNRKITTACRQQHDTRGCAANSVEHNPLYYNSLQPHGDPNIYRCPYCGALLLKSEATGPNRYSKCCAKGKINLAKEFYDMLDPFLRPDQRSQPNEDRYNRLNNASKVLDLLLNELITGQNNDYRKFRKNARNYNREFSCGTISTVSQPVLHGYPVIKINGQVGFNLSGLHPPATVDPDSGANRVHFGGQVWTLDPEEAIQIRQGRIHNRSLNDHFLDQLHRLFHDPIIGHQYARAYKSAEQIFREQQQELGNSLDVNKFHVRLLSPDEVQQMGGPDEQQRAIHPHRLLLPAEQTQLAQVYMIEGDDPTPPMKEKGIILTGRDGLIVQLPWWDIHVDGALFPLMFPRCGTIWRPFLPKIPLEEEDQNLETEVLPPMPPPVMQMPNDELDDYNDDNPVAEANLFDDEQPHPQLAEPDIEGEGEQFIVEDQRHHKYVSKSQAARYHMQIREPLGNPGPADRNPWRDPHFIWWDTALAEEYVCILTNKIERERYAEFKKKQKDLRNALPASMIAMLEGRIRHLQDASGQPLNARGKLGKVYIPPETMRGSRKYYQRAFGDATAICRKEGNPHLLITFTMNRNAPEFNTMFSKEQTCYNRCDIAARLFIDKQEEFLKDIVQRHVMGPVKGWFYSVEHQKRGLAHMHLVVILDWDKINMTKEEYIDEYICAEIPPKPRDDDNTLPAKIQRRYRDLVCEQMYHTCNPHFCLKNNKCTKRFPKPNSERTVVDHRGIGVNYRRRPNAESHAEWANNRETLGCHHEQGKDNRYVVPHNRFLLCKYQSHINVEWIEGDACIKYVLKYVMKGADLAFIQVVPADEDGTGQIRVDYDETREMSLARYQTANEGFLTIYGNKIVRHSHQCDVNYVHLPEEYRVVFREGEEDLAAEEEEERLQQGEEQRTPLTAYFALNRRLAPAEAELFTYETINRAFYYHKKDKVWKRRTQLRANHLSRLGTVGATNHDAQLLRMLLLHVRGPTGWDDLRGADGTFKSKAVQLGLLEDHMIWVNTILEAFRSMPGFGRRFNWLATLFANNDIHDAQLVLNDVLASRDQWLRPRNMLNSPIDDVRQYVLHRLEYVFRLQNVSRLNHPTCCEALGLDAPINFQMTQNDVLDSIYRAGDFHQAHMIDDDDDTGPPTFGRYQNQLAAGQQGLNVRQRGYVYCILSAALNRRHNANRPVGQHIFMLTGDGGTGKTFANNVLIAALKVNKFNVLVTASTGIASELLFEGGTMHNRLRIPLEVDEKTVPKVDYESELAVILRALDVLIIDEISSVHKNIMYYVDRLLRSIDRDRAHLEFAGKIIVMCGDWKQLLPIVKDYDLNSAYDASVKNTRWFKDGLVDVHHLDEIMRLVPGQDIYKKKLKCWGTGYGTTNRDTKETRVDESMVVNSELDLIDFVFGDALDDPMTAINMERLATSAILTPLNDTALKLDRYIQSEIRGAFKTYKSIDRTISDRPDDALAINIAGRNIENIYRRTPPGLPPHELVVKVGAIMMIVRNISIPHGLCNGTRVQIVGLGKDVIHCRYIYGPRKGRQFELSRFRFKFGGPDDPDRDRYGGVLWERLQFPLRPGFVLTTNKSQGQTLERVGLHLGESQCFSHGQFYVAVSRVKNGMNIRIFTLSNYRLVKNIVVRRIIDDIDIELAKEYVKDLEAERAQNQAARIATPPPTSGTVPVQDMPAKKPADRPLRDALTPPPTPPPRPFQCPLQGEMRQRCPRWRQRKYEFPYEDVIYEDAVPSGDCLFWAAMLAARGLVELPSDPMYAEWPEQYFHQELWRDQSQLRMWVAERQKADYLTRMTDEEIMLREQAIDILEYEDFNDYIERMKMDANLDPRAYGSVELEGPFVARSYGRPLAVYRDDGNVFVCFPNAINVLTFNQVQNPMEIREFTYQLDENGKPEHGTQLHLVNPIVIRFIGNDHFQAVYFEDEQIFEDCLDSTTTADMEEQQRNELTISAADFAVPSPAIRTPVNADIFNFEEQFAQMSVTPKSVPTPGWPVTPQGNQQQMTPSPQEKDSPFAKKQRLQQVESPLAKQLPQKSIQMQPKTTAKRQIIAEPPIPIMEEVYQRRDLRTIEQTTIENVPGDGDCFYWAIVRSLLGIQDRRLTQTQLDQQRQNMLALRRLVARSIWQRHHTANADERTLLYEQADLDQNHYRNAGIISLRSYVDMIMRSARGNTLAYANFHLEGMEVARGLGRPLIVESIIHQPNGQIRRSAVLHTTTRRSLFINMLNNYDQLRNLEIIERPDGEIVHADTGGDGWRMTIDNPIVVRITQYEHPNALPSYGHFYAVHLNPTNPNADEGIHNLDDVPMRMWDAYEDEPVQPVVPPITIAPEPRPLPEEEEIFITAKNSLYMKNKRRDVQQLPKTSLGKKVQRRRSSTTEENPPTTSAVEQQIPEQQFLERQTETPLSPEQRRMQEHRARMDVLQRLADKEHDRLGITEQERRDIEQSRPIFTEEELNIIREITPIDVVDLEFGCGPYHMDSTPHRKGLEWRIRNENPPPSRKYVFKRLMEREQARYEMEGEEDIGQEDSHLLELFEQQALQRKQEEEKRRVQMEMQRKKKMEWTEARRIAKEGQQQSSTSSQSFIDKVLDKAKQVTRRLDPTQHRESPPKRWDRPRNDANPQQRPSFISPLYQRSPMKQTSYNSPSSAESEKEKQQRLWQNQMMQQNANLEQQNLEAEELRRKRLLADRQQTQRQRTAEMQDEEEWQRYSAEKQLQQQQQPFTSEWIPPQNEEEEEDADLTPYMMVTRLKNLQETESAKRQRNAENITAILRKVKQVRDQPIEEEPLPEEPMEMEEQPEEIVEPMEIEEKQQIWERRKKQQNEGRPSQGFPEADLRRMLPRSRIRLEEMDEQCIYCKEPLNDGRNLCRLQCNHIFHRECIGHWLQNSNTCPWPKCGKVLNAAGNMDLSASLPYQPTTDIPRQPAQPQPNVQTSQTTIAAQQQPPQYGRFFQNPMRCWRTRFNNLFVAEGDILNMRIDAIVNAANPSLLGGGGIDAVIHTAAGPQLLAECEQISKNAHGERCPTGGARITAAYDIRNVRYIIHTVGPQIEPPRGRQPTAFQRDQLRQCYRNCMNLAKAQGIRSIAFPCISVGIYNFPKAEAAKLAVHTIIEWLENNPNYNMEAIFFIIFNDDGLVENYRSFIE